jgi:hypothetical protein
MDHAVWASAFAEAMKVIKGDASPQMTLASIWTALARVGLIGDERPWFPFRSASRRTLADSQGTALL